MPLVPCRECKRDVSTHAKVCPSCGAPMPFKQQFNGRGFEWKSSIDVYGYPLIHIAFGRDENNKIRVAKGIIAIGQFAIGLVTIAQFGMGLLFGFGQFILGPFVIAQFAFALVLGVGQISIAYIAIGQIAIGYYGLAQLGIAKYVWSTYGKDIEAIQFFQQLLEVL